MYCVGVLQSKSIMVVVCTVMADSDNEENNLAGFENSPRSKGVGSIQYLLTYYLHLDI